MLLRVGLILFLASSQGTEGQRFNAKQAQKSQQSILVKEWLAPCCGDIHTNVQGN